MAVTLNSIYADVLAQINSLDATTVALLQTVYQAAVGGSIADVDMNSTDWAIDQIKNAILDAELELINEICQNPKHPERGTFQKTSSNITSGDAVPATASDLTPFFGQFDYAKETSGSLILTPRPLLVVQAAIRNSNSAFSANYRALCWCIAGGTVLHNSSGTINLVGVGAARNTFPSGSIRLRDYYRPAVVAGAMLKMLPKEGANPTAFQEYSQLYNGQLAQIRAIGQATGAPTPA